MLSIFVINGEPVYPDAEKQDGAWDAWRTIFSDLFPDGARETETYKFDEYISRFDMVNALIEEQDARKKLPNSQTTTRSPSVW